MRNKAFDHSKYQHWIDPNKVIPYERNAKIHDDKQVENICTSIRRFGWQQDTVLTSDNVLVIGHGRRLAALKLGCEMPYHVIDKTADELTDEDIRELRIADNQTNAETELDLEMLGVEIGELDFAGFDFDFGFADDGAEWFDRENRNDTSRQEGNEEYNEFLEKFEEKKTTDDCYTPDNVYEAVAGWVEQEYGISRKRNAFVRPFYPGGDYQNFSYPAGCVVVDNPPFSILAEIIDFYVEKGIRFFLFAPGLAALNYVTRDKVCAVCTYASVMYENGASVCTSFVTNLGDGSIIAYASSELYEAISEANDINEKAMHLQMPKYEYPVEVLTAAKFGWLAKYGQSMKIRRAESYFIRTLDAMKESGKGIYGNGLLLSERAAAERAAAERAAAERAAAERANATVWELSEREKEIVRSLGHDEA